MGVKIVLEPGPVTYPVDEADHREVIAFIEDPDGYPVELIEPPASQLRSRSVEA